MDMQTGTELPKWKSHKTVWADQIVRIDAAEAADKEASGFYWALKSGGLISVPRSLIARGRPDVGDYYVVYQDGYQSWSPKAAFEDGYSRI